MENKGKNMKRIIISSVCIGTLALALTAWGQEANNNNNNNKRPARAHPQQRTANVRGATPANTGAMRAHNYSSTGAYRQPAHVTAPRTSLNAVARQNQMRVSRERNNVAAKTRAVRPASTTPATARERNNVAVNRNRNVGVNQRSNYSYYRGGNARINNNFHSAAFRGQQYAAFRNYHRQWHDRGWWRSHYNTIVFVNGGWWYWNASYWFPAWGYAAGAYYPYDGPIYGYNGMSPDQVTADVQQQLQRDGYYDGPIDGSLGPMTREAIAAFQADNGLSVTSVIDQPTLSALGVA
jgi:hypothetical protein